MKFVITGLVVLCLLSCSHVSPQGNLSYVVDGDAITQPLVEQNSSVVIGRQVFEDRNAGHCLLCHRVAQSDAPFQGDIGPELSSVGARLTAEQIRFRIVDASKLNPNTIMPPYYRRDNLNQVAVKYQNEPALTAAQIEHLVIYLSSLKGQDL